MIGLRNAMETVTRHLNHRVLIHRTPSFHAMLCREHRVYNALQPGGDGSPLYDWETKPGGKALADRVGVRSAAVLQGPTTAASIDWGALPDRFVCKPTWGSSRRGVLVISRDGDSFKEWLTGRTFDEQALARATASSRGEIIVEEAIGNRIPPDDWKFFTFRGEIVLILQIRREDGAARYKYYDSNWHDAGAVSFGRTCDPSLPLPRRPDDLTDAASRLSTAIQVPFSRIDLYESEFGPIFGEITPRPGRGHRYRLAWDQELGRAWERAEAELRSVSARPHP